MACDESYTREQVFVLDRLLRFMLASILARGKEPLRDEIRHAYKTMEPLPETTVKVIPEKSMENGLAEAFGSGRGRNDTLSHAFPILNKSFCALQLAIQRANVL